MTRSIDYLTKLLNALPDEQFKAALTVTAMLLQELRAEAIRRGIWDELKGKKDA